MKVGRPKGSKNQKPDLDPQQPLPNPVHEVFALGVATGRTATDAYRAANPEAAESSVASLASRLVNSRPIQARINHLRGFMAQSVLERTVVDREWVRAALKQNALAARAEGDFSASNQAIVALGKDLGMFRESNERIPWDGDLRKLSLPQLEMILTSLAALETAEEEAERKMLADGAVDVTPTPVQ